MREIVAKTSESEYGSYQAYKLLRDETTKINNMQMQINKMQHEINELKQLINKLTNGGGM